MALTNLLLMRRPRATTGGGLAVLIPARNEADNLAELVPALVAQGARVYVYDDGSDDGTAEVAARAGAKVLRGGANPPKGWLGKNHACHQLALAAIEDDPGDWMLFLDADVRPRGRFVPAMGGLAETAGRRCPLVTGFPRLVAGRGLEPLVLGWVGWILLATNPFGLVSRTGRGHNRFANGQVMLWRKSSYVEILPHQAVRGRVLEDVMIGRLMAREGWPVEVANLCDVLQVRMYRNWREALDGMSKNSFEIAGSVAGTTALAAFLLVCGWLWTLAWPAAYAALALSALAAGRVVRYPVWTAPLAPIWLSAGALTLVRSAAWRRRGRVVWKGRTLDV